MTTGRINQVANPRRRPHATRPSDAPPRPGDAQRPAPSPPSVAPGPQDPARDTQPQGGKGRNGPGHTSGGRGGGGGAGQHDATTGGRAVGRAAPTVIHTEEKGRERGSGRARSRGSHVAAQAFRSPPVESRDSRANPIHRIHKHTTISGARRHGRDAVAHAGPGTHEMSLGAASHPPEGREKPKEGRRVTMLPHSGYRRYSPPDRPSAGEGRNESPSALAVGCTEAGGPPMRLGTTPLMCRHSLAERDARARTPSHAARPRRAKQ